MKKYLHLLNISAYALLFLIGREVRAANDPDVEKRKTYSKSYAITASDKISINNQFGEVKVNAWSKNEIKVDVTIIAKAATDERAQEIIEGISIEDGKGSNGIYFKTNMKNDHKTRDKKKSYKEEKMEINYQVYMPVSNALTLINQFGATIIPDMDGLVDVTSKFGSLTTGKLSNVKKLSIEFGSATIESISNGILEVKFSRAIINKSDGSVDAVFEHASGVKLGIANNTKELKVTSAFSTVYLNVNKNLSATFNISTSFGELSNKTDFDIKEDGRQEGRKKNFGHSYSGKAGNGNASLKIGSSFSQITLGHDLSMNLKKTIDH